MLKRTMLALGGTFREDVLSNDWMFGDMPPTQVNHELSMVEVLIGEDCGVYPDDNEFEPFSFFDGSAVRNGRHDGFCEDTIIDQIDARYGETDEDKDEIDAKSKALAEASAGLAQRIYEEQAQSAGSEEAAAGAQGPAGGDDVVDAEFEEVKEDKAKDA